MSHSPLLRSAVYSCLIAAMVIQPMVIVASQGTCTQGQCCEATLVCHACKCCEVKTDGELCGCCIRSEVDADNCCSKKAAKPKHDNLLREISDVVPEPPESDDEELAQGRGALSPCTCGIRSEPIAPAPHRVPVPQARDLIVIAYLDHVASETGFSIARDQVSSRLPIGNLSPHFSQRFLCIWRI